MEPSDVSIEEERVIRIPDHEVLLVFRGDNMAETFHDWWYSKGLSAFLRHANKAAKEGRDE